MSATRDAKRPATKKPDRPAVTGEILDRVPPHAVDAERSLLASILLMPELIDEVVLTIAEDDFYDSKHLVVFAAMLAISAKGKIIDTSLLVDALQRAGTLESAGGVTYLATIAVAVATPANCAYYAQLVSEASAKRRLIHAACRMIQDGYDTSVGGTDALDAAESGLFDVLDSRRSARSVATVGTILATALDAIEARADGRAPPGGLMTGFPEIDSMLGGLRSGELSILAARPSMGKTSLALNLAELTGLAGASVLICSLEMGAQEIGERLLSSAGKVDLHRIRGGFISSEDRRRLIEAHSRLAAAKILIDDSASLSVTEIAANARRTKRSKTGLDLLVIDYLQLIAVREKSQSREQEVAGITRRLKTLARELKIPILCACQLNRQVEQTGDKRPRLSHLRESGAIEQDADVVMFVHRPGYYERSPADATGSSPKVDETETELIVAKQRNGPTGTIPLVWFKEFTRFAPAVKHRSAGTGDPTGLDTGRESGRDYRAPYRDADDAF